MSGVWHPSPHNKQHVRTWCYHCGVHILIFLHFMDMIVHYVYDYSLLNRTSTFWFYLDSSWTHYSWIIAVFQKNMLSRSNVCTHFMLAGVLLIHSQLSMIVDCCYQNFILLHKQYVPMSWVSHHSFDDMPYFLSLFLRNPSTWSLIFFRQARGTCAVYDQSDLYNFWSFLHE